MQQTKNRRWVPWSAAQLPQVPAALRGWEAPLAIFVIFLLAQIVAAVTVLAVTGFPETPDKVTPAQIVATTLVASAIGFAAIVAYVSLRSKELALSTLGFRRFQPKPALLALAGGAGAIAVLEVLLRVAVPQEWIPPHPFTEAVQAGTAVQLWLVALAGLVLAPLFEETAFRGYLLPAISQRLGFVAGAGLSSLVFALLHPSPVMIGFAFLLGLVLAWAYKQSGSLWVPILLHFGVNAIAFAGAAGMF